jgi:hypothetical protein
MANIAVVGSGYVGLVSGACLADFGNKVICMDNDEAKINALKEGGIPIYEPGLKDLVQKGCASSRLSFTTSLKEAVSSSEVIFIAVGTPPQDDGSADLQYVESVARGIAPFITSYKVIVDKSTVPVGTGRKVATWIKDEAKKKGITIADFDVVSNPEFLREGSAILDFTHPDRVVIGSESEKARNIMKNVYRVLYLNDTPYIETNLESAEMIKYASNAFLAMKITYINQIANLCEKVGANVKDVAKAMGRDGRIGSKFLHPGPGYGGSCFPKDTKALSKIAKDASSPISIIDIVIEENEKQKLKMVEKINLSFGGETSIKGKVFAILGLSFKPNTDDMREAPSLVILEELVKMGAVLHATDPAAMKEAKWRLKHIEASITYFDDIVECVKGSDAIVLLTEWNQYRTIDLRSLKKSMKGNRFFDFRNVYDPKTISSYGFEYVGVGLPSN